ncbi:ParB N-terminal domain-containing protein [Sulfitobacter sp. F26204]|uniref:ParB/RepB/Spo0J family partition protein n=1 Tax=Sulfitobacter sp. F26204 TaxID=2996014 RepID=UPI00225E0377|nr:ParB N-terminal domain-containing protein [Sulfitobacter sp. F26204]MCX7561615.1 ParB N-terminal domain-containing protein [Sulfitobacter sp. F26204]
MARKRKLEGAAVTPAVEPPQADAPAMGGMWGGSAMNMLKQRLSDTRESIAKGVVNGTLALELKTRQILDHAGTDRLGDWKKDAEFLALVENIKRRGQVQPIRVRPLKKDWKPQLDYPLQSADTFVIQSGRRRLAACEALGIKVKAVVATESGDRALADLEERFHENTMRKNLSGFEELLSIGVLADALTDLTQEEVAARLGVAQGDVSLGRACAEMHDRIVAEVDIATTPKREFRKIIPQLRAKEKKPASKPKSKPEVVEVNRAGLKVTIKPASGGLSVAVKTGKEVDQKWLAAQIADLLSE